MKISQILLGLIIGFGSCLLLSADIGNRPTEEVPRYHLFYTDGGLYYVFDAVTGEYKKVVLGDVRKGSNIKTLLEN